jgi:hypothetical protein
MATSEERAVLMQDVAGRGNLGPRRRFQDIMIPFIDRAVAREHLELAERHVAEGQLRVTSQLALLSRLERHGHDTHQAKTLLYQLEESLALQMQTRACIAQELSEGM